MPTTARKAKTKEKESPIDAPDRSSRRRKKTGGSLAWLWIAGGFALIVVLGGFLVRNSKSGRRQQAKDGMGANIDVGAWVEITTTCTSAGGHDIDLGWLGLVDKFRENGDVLLDFKDVRKRMWVAHTNFDKLNVYKNATSSEENSTLRLRDKLGLSQGETREKTYDSLSIMLRLKEMAEIATTLQAVGEMSPHAAADLGYELADIEDAIKAGEGKADPAQIRDLLSMASVVRGTLAKHSSNLTDEEVDALNNSWTFSNPRYWDDYYSKTSSEERYDWFGSWDSELTAVSDNVPEGTRILSDLLKMHIRKEDKILIFGCGNSNMSETMYMDGYENIVNIDVSQSLIDLLKERLQGRMPKMQWLTMSGADTSFADGEFDVVFDKGTFDAIEDSHELLSASIQEIHRTLKRDGLLISITFRDSDARVQNQFRKHSSWGECIHQTFDRMDEVKTLKYHVHTCRSQ